MEKKEQKRPVDQAVATRMSIGERIGVLLVIIAIGSVALGAIALMLVPAKKKVTPIPTSTIGSSCTMEEVCVLDGQEVSCDLTSTNSNGNANSFFNTNGSTNTNSVTNTNTNTNRLVNSNSNTNTNANTNGSTNTNSSSNTNGSTNAYSNTSDPWLAGPAVVPNTTGVATSSVNGNQNGNGNSNIAVCPIPPRIFSNSAASSSSENILTVIERVYNSVRREVDEFRTQTLPFCGGNIQVQEFCKVKRTKYLIIENGVKKEKGTNTVYVGITVTW